MRHAFMSVLVTLVMVTPGLSLQGKDNCEYHYFRNHKVSTSQCYKDGRFGKAIAYDKTGKVIYEKEIRKIAGHSHVTFEYYKGGAVKKADWSSAPDAGIQWYRSTTTFAEDGTVTGNTETSHNDMKHLTVPPQLRENRK